MSGTATFRMTYLPRCPARYINIWQQKAYPEQQCEKVKIVKKSAKKAAKEVKPAAKKDADEVLHEQARSCT